MHPPLLLSPLLLPPPPPPLLCPPPLLLPVLHYQLAAMGLYPQESAEKRGTTDAEKEANRLAWNTDNTRKRREKWGDMPKEE